MIFFVKLFIVIVLGCTGTFHRLPFPDLVLFYNAGDLFDLIIIQFNKRHFGGEGLEHYGNGYL